MTTEYDKLLKELTTESIVLPNKARMIAHRLYELGYTRGKEATIEILKRTHDTKPSLAIEKGSN